jgi:hypothetical protein
VQLRAAFTSIVNSRLTGVPAAKVFDVTIMESCQKPSKTPEAEVSFTFIPKGRLGALSTPVVETEPVIAPKFTVPEPVPEADELMPGSLKLTDADNGLTTMGDGERVAEKL